MNTNITPILKYVTGKLFYYYGGIVVKFVKFESYSIIKKKAAQTKIRTAKHIQLSIII